MFFHEKKFLSFSAQQQHKKCAELLRVFFCTGCDPAQWEHYQQLRLWMGLQVVDSSDGEAISHLYHWHLSQTGRGVKEHGLLPQVRTGDLAQPRAPSLDISVYLDSVRSAHNVGSILRTMEAFALGELILSPHTPQPDSKKVLDTAMGCAKHIPWRVCSDLDSLPRPLIVLETAQGASPIDSYQFPTAFCLAVGNEEYGCSKALLARADAIIEIPLWGRKNSLNVANATAIAAGFISAQLRKK